MAKTRRIIRKTNPARYRAVDDQLWPLAIACCVLGGFLAGTVLAYFRLDNPHWYANAWTWLIAIPLVILSLLVTLAVTGNRLLRRSMQLALVLGLIFHLVLLILSIETDVFHRAWTEVLASPRRPTERKVVKLPDYASWQHDPRQRVRRDLEQPLETKLPDPALEPLPREKAQEDPIDVQVEPPSTPEPQRATRPDVVRRDQSDAAVPRQSEQMSRLSRRDAVVPPLPTQAARADEVQRIPERRPDLAEPGAAGTLSAKQSVEVERSALPTATQLPEAAPTQQMARRSQPTEEPGELSSAASMRRSDARPGVTPRTDVQVGEQGAVARRSEPDAVTPNNTAARQQQTRSPVTQQKATLPVQERTSEAVTRRRTQQQAAPQQRSLAQTPRSIPNAQPRVTPRPDVATMAELAATATRDQSESEPLGPTPLSRLDQPAAAPAGADPARSASLPESAASTVTPSTAQRAVAQVDQPGADSVSAKLPGRQPASATALGAVPQRISPVAPEATSRRPVDASPGGLAASPATVAKSVAGNTAAERATPSTELTGTARQSQTAARQPARPLDASRPSLETQATADQLARRTTREALEASSPVPTENVARDAEAPGPRTVDAGPSSMALSKAEAGTAGFGASANLGLADPAADSPAQVASGSAQRAEALQSAPQGPALAPQAPALVRDSRAGKLQPSAVLLATPLSPATLPGSRDPGELNASASAALTQAASDAKHSTITASKGAWEVDLGPTTTVAEMGVGRASGGGQPDRSAGAQTPSVPRSSSGVTPAASLLADAPSSVPAAPMSEGAVAVSPTDLPTHPNASVNARQGTDAPTPGGPPADLGGTGSAPTRALTMSNRRAVDATGGPEMTEDTAAVPYTGSKASRDRQMESEAGVADLIAGNAAIYNDRQLPAASVAASSAASTIEKQPAGRAESPVSEPVAAADVPQDRAGGGELAARAEVVEAARGVPQVGGGTDSPPRSAQGPPLVANTRADTSELSGAPTSSGRPEPEPQSSQGTLITRLADGANAPRNDARVGAIAAAIIVDAADGDAPGLGPPRPSRSGATSDGPLMQNDATAGPLEKHVTTLLPPSAGVAAELPDIPAGAITSSDEDSEPGPIARLPSPGPLSRLSGAAMPVAADAVAGPGGLSRDVTVDVGVNDRRAAEVSQQVQLDVARFVRQRVGGMPEFNTSAAIPTDSFRRRERRGDGMGELPAGAGPRTEEAIELGLVFLSRAQVADGRWTLDRFAARDGLPQIGSDTAATGLALLAFQGAGYHHMEYRYAEVVRRGIDFLVQNQRPDGNLFVSMDEQSNRVVALYSHSIAALALCEAYGMTQDAALREPAQKAINYIAHSQHPQRGGWRYTPRVGADTSVTGWMMMALKSGELANLDVPTDTYARIRLWLDKAQVSTAQPYLFCYNPFAPDTPQQRGGRRPTRTMTSVGLLMRLYSGWRRDNANMVLGAKHLLQYPPSLGTVSNPQRDTYYWYYATQVMFHMGGQYWQAWNQRLHPLLIGSQIREGDLAGSWDPSKPIPDEWSAYAGRLYVTTMNLLSLEVAYRHLPLYEDTAR